MFQAYRSQHFIYFTTSRGLLLGFYIFQRGRENPRNCRILLGFWPHEVKKIFFSSSRCCTVRCITLYTASEDSQLGRCTSYVERETTSTPGAPRDVANDPSSSSQGTDTFGITELRLFVMRIIVEKRQLLLFQSFRHRKERFEKLAWLWLRPQLSFLQLFWPFWPFCFPNPRFVAAISGVLRIPAFDHIIMAARLHFVQTTSGRSWNISTFFSQFSSHHIFSSQVFIGFSSVVMAVVGSVYKLCKSILQVFLSLSFPVTLPLCSSSRILSPIPTAHKWRHLFFWVFSSKKSACKSWNSSPIRSLDTICATDFCRSCRSSEQSSQPDSRVYFLCSVCFVLDLEAAAEPAGRHNSWQFMTIDVTHDTWWKRLDMFGFLDIFVKAFYDGTMFWILRSFFSWRSLWKWSPLAPFATMCFGWNNLNRWMVWLDFVFETQLQMALD